MIDSQGIEMNFAQALEYQNEVIVYPKLHGGFYINTPAGHYNPDWAMVFKEDTDIKHIYFVAETKGYSDDEVIDYRSAESVKIECARRHFKAISDNGYIYDVARDYKRLYDIVTK
ncbi:MAG: type III restriction endonuclease subunit R [Muribaculaceae bacterium]